MIERIIYYFSAANCGACNDIKTDILSFQEAYPEIPFQVIQGDASGLPEEFATFAVENTPTLIVAEPDPENDEAMLELFRASGATDVLSALQSITDFFEVREPVEVPPAIPTETVGPFAIRPRDFAVGLAVGYFIFK